MLLGIYIYNNNDKRTPTSYWTNEYGSIVPINKVVSREHYKQIEEWVDNENKKFALAGSPRLAVFFPVFNKYVNRDIVNSLHMQFKGDEQQVAKVLNMVQSQCWWCSNETEDGCSYCNF